LTGWKASLTLLGWKHFWKTTLQQRSKSNSNPVKIKKEIKTTFFQRSSFSKPYDVILGAYRSTYSFYFENNSCEISI
jgi:hypothetical protein